MKLFPWSSTDPFLVVLHHQQICWVISMSLWMIRMVMSSSLRLLSPAFLALPFCLHGHTDSCMDWRTFQPVLELNCELAIQELEQESFEISCSIAFRKKKKQNKPWVYSPLQTRCPQLYGSIVFAFHVKGIYQHKSLHVWDVQVL